MKKCNFCEDYKHIKKLDDEFDKKASCDPTLDFEIRHKHKVQIASITQKRIRGRSNWNDNGRSTRGAYSIHYCPVCGRKI